MAEDNGDPNGAASAIPYHVNRNTLIIAMIIGVLFVLTRTAVRWHASRRFSWGEDGFCWLALACQICITGIYLSILNDIYFFTKQSKIMMDALANGNLAEAALHPDMEYHVEKMMKGITPIQDIFWTCLWSVKLSLLFMFKRLTERVPLHLKVWWGVLVFTVLAFISCIALHLLSCSDIRLFTKMGGCSSEKDLRLQSISLYYSLAIDVLTDIMIMAIPLSLIWNLKINIWEKIGVGMAFSAGLATIIVALLRGFTLKKSSTSQQVADVTWLCFWASVECCIAIVVNCLPSFAFILRNKVREHRSGGGTHSNGYGQMDSKPRTGMKSEVGRDRDNIEMDDMERYSTENDDTARGYRTRPDPGKYLASVSVGKVRPRRTPGSAENLSHSSQESIIGPEQRTKEVYVTRTVDIS